MIKILSMLLLFCSMSCGGPSTLKTVQVSLNQPLTSFDSEDILSLWVYKESMQKCAALDANVQDLTEDDEGFISKQVANARILSQDNTTLAFDLEDLPADAALSFLVRITNNGPGEVLTFGCNRSDAIGQGNLLELQIVLPKIE
jgi:hypothetical protein